jgi:predicted nucleotidyltransferase
MNLTQVRVSEAEITHFARHWKIVELALFGSVLREDFHKDSDVDILVTFAEGFHPTLADYMDIEEALTALFGRKVDVIERRLVEQSDHYIRRRHILNSAQVIYRAEI